MTRIERQEAENAWIKFERETNKDLEERGVQYRLVYLPPKDLMPYNDAARVTEIQNATEKLLDDWEENEGNVSPVGILTVTEEWTKTISMALTVYKAALLAVHGERFRKEIKEGMEKRRRLMAKNITALLEEKGMTQRELADKAKLTEVTVSRIVQGKREPMYTQLHDIATALEVTIEDLMEERESDA